MPNVLVRILLIGGSLRRGSTNHAVLATAQKLAPAGAQLILYDGLEALPHFSPDDDREPLPASVARLRAGLADADAVLFSTPEYAGSLPGSFKNLLDWTVGDGLYRKPVGYINASAHGGAAGAHDTLRVVFQYVSADVVTGACVQLPVRRDCIDAHGVIGDAEVRNGISTVLAALVEHVASLKSAAS